MAATNTVLKRGSRGPGVLMLQEMLLALGYDIGSDRPDGVFGDATYMAVKEFQMRHGLSADGAAGSQTLPVLTKYSSTMTKQQYKERFVDISVTTPTFVDKTELTEPSEKILGLTTNMWLMLGAGAVGILVLRKV